VNYKDIQTDCENLGSEDDVPLSSLVTDKITAGVFDKMKDNGDTMTASMYC
jgi:hypothetical protein